MIKAFIVTDHSSGRVEGVVNFTATVCELGFKEGSNEVFLAPSNNTLGNAIDEDEAGTKMSVRNASLAANEFANRALGPWLRWKTTRQVTLSKKEWQILGRKVKNWRYQGPKALRMRRLECWHRLCGQDLDKGIGQQRLHNNKETHGESPESGLSEDGLRHQPSPISCIYRDLWSFKASWKTKDL